MTKNEREQFKAEFITGDWGMLRKCGGVLAKIYDISL